MEATSSLFIITESQESKLISEPQNRHHDSPSMTLHSKECGCSVLDSNILFVRCIAAFSWSHKLSLYFVVRMIYYTPLRRRRGRGCYRYSYHIIWYVHRINSSGGFTFIARKICRETRPGEAALIRRYYAYHTVLTPSVGWYFGSVAAWRYNVYFAFD